MNDAFLQTDVVVIGAGLAGHCAAIEAAHAGVRVLLIERESAVGGSSVLSGGSFAFAGTDKQAAAGVEDTPELLARDFLAVGGHRNDPALVNVYAQNQLAAYQWLVARGVQFGPLISGAGQSVPRLHPANPVEVVRLLTEEILANKAITLVTDARVTRLHRNAETGRVDGVAWTHGGQAMQTEVKGGVVITSGGFSRNQQMMEEICPGQAKATRVGGNGSQGEGLKLAGMLGAGLRDMAYVKGTFGNHPDAHPREHTAMLAIYKGAIAVNKLGRRFADESISYKLLGDACLQQPDAIGYQILDQTIMEQAVPVSPMFNFPKRLEEGRLFKADTLEALAERIGVDAQTLTATVTRYNEDVAKGRDTEFGREGIVQGYGKLTPIQRAPFYAYPSTSAVIATYCGLTVAPDMGVIDLMGEPIAGLYAAGEVTGGFHGQAFMTGTSLGKCVVCGRVAGASAAAH
jgi:fumarate reductase flavoprotein subunit